MREDLSKKTQRFYASLWGVELKQSSAGAAGDATADEVQPAKAAPVPAELLEEVRAEVEVTQQMIREFNDVTVRWPCVGLSSVSARVSSWLEARARPHSHSRTQFVAFSFSWALLFTIACQLLEKRSNMSAHLYHAWPDFHLFFCTHRLALRRRRLRLTLPSLQGGRRSCPHCLSSLSTATCLSLFTSATSFPSSRRPPTPARQRCLRRGARPQAFWLPVSCRLSARSRASRMAPRARQ